MTKTMMFGPLVSMVTAQALVCVSQGAFLITITEKKHQVTQERNNFLQIMFTLDYAMNQNDWLALILCREKILKNCKNRPFWPIHQCFACCSKRNHQISIILVHCIQCLSTLSLSLGKLEKLKAWKNRNVPIYLFHASVNIENCIGLRKKFLGLGRLGLCISVRISSAEVFVLHWSNGGK